MIATSFKVQVEEDGEIRIPREVVKAIGAAPHQEVQVTVTLPQLSKPRVPVKLTEEQRAKFDEALMYLRKSMEGVDVADALRHIREGRRDRWF